MDEKEKAKAMTYIVNRGWANRLLKLMKTSDMPIEDIFTMIISEIEKDDAKRIEKRR